MVHAPGRAIALAAWSLALALGAYLYFFQHDALRAQLAGLAGVPTWWIYCVYLSLGCVRGFTLVPATYLVLGGMLVLQPVPLFLLTIAGIIV
jgi:hypothetical protein